MDAVHKSVDERLQVIDYFEGDVRVMANKNMKLAGLAAAALALNMGFAVEGASAQGLTAALNNPSDGQKSTAVYFGADFSPHEYSLETGFVTALSGDISQDGFLFAGILGFGESDSKSGGVKSDEDTFTGSILIGYQAYLDGIYVAAFAGLDWQDTDTKPSDPKDGSDFGFKVEGEFETSTENALYFGLGGSYTTIDDGYWVRGRAGYSMGAMKFGPEVTASGDNDTDAVRVGGFVSDIELGMINLGFAIGYHDENNNSRKDGVYGTVELTTEF